MASDTKSEEPMDSMHLMVLTVLTGLSKYRRTVVGVFVVLVPLIALAIPGMPKSYTSTAVVQLRKSLGTSMSERAGLEEVDFGEIEDYRETQTSLLKSAMLHEDVGRRLLDEELLDEKPNWKGELRAMLVTQLSSGAADDYVDEAVLEAKRVADAGTYVSNGLGVQRGHRSPLVSLAFEHENAETAQRILQIVLEEYSKTIGALYQIDDVLGLAHERRDAAEAEWRERLDQLETLRARHDIHDLPRQLMELRKEVATIEADVIAKTLEYEEAEGLAEALEDAVTQMPAEFDATPARFPNPAHATLTRLLEDARRRHADAPFADGTAESEALLEPISELETQLDDQPMLVVEDNPGIPNINYHSLRREYAVARANVDASASGLELLKRREIDLRARLDQLENIAPEHDSLERQMTAAHDAFVDRSDHAKKLARTKDLGDANVLWSFKAVQEPTLPSNPSSISRMILAVVGLVVSVALGVFVALARGLLDGTVRSPYDVDGLFGSPAVACFPDLARRQDVAVMLARVGARGAKVRRLVREARSVDGPADFSSVGPHAGFMRSRVGGLVSTVRELRETNDPFVIVVAGAHHGVGASTVARNLARALDGAGGERALLVDCTGPRTREGREGELVEETDGLLVWNRGRGGHVDADVRGRVPDRSWVIVDSDPPLDGHEPALENGADVCLVVAEADRTRRSVLSESVHLLEHASGGRMGVVVNRVHFHLRSFARAA